VKTSKGNSKQSLAAQYEAEARRLAGYESSTERRFLSMSLEKGKELEPIGGMTCATFRHLVDTK